MYGSTVIILTVVISCAIGQEQNYVEFETNGDQPACYLNYTRYAGHHLRGSSELNHVMSIVSSYDECVEKCCRNEGMECKSFTFGNFGSMIKYCYIMNVNQNDANMKVVSTFMAWTHGQRDTAGGGDFEDGSGVISPDATA